MMHKKGWGNGGSSNVKTGLGQRAQMATLFTHSAACLSFDVALASKPAKSHVSEFRAQS